MAFTPPSMLTSAGGEVPDPRPKDKTRGSMDLTQKALPNTLACAPPESDLGRLQAIQRGWGWVDLLETMTPKEFF